MNLLSKFISKQLIPDVTKFLKDCLSQLPISNSIISLMIVLTVLDYYEKNEELCFKKLYSSLHFFSDVGIKNHLVRLNQNEWVMVMKSTRDTRLKLIHPSEKLLSAYQNIRANRQR